MIEAATGLIASQLNQFLRRTFGLTEDIVVISNILEQDGTVTPRASNKLVLFLINIEKDTAPHRRPNGNTAGANRAVVTYPPIYLNLYLMIAGHYSGEHYTESLKFISQAIGFFQKHPVFDHQNTPELDGRIEKLVLEIENLNLHDLGTLWGSLGGKYLPSILYKMRMVAFDSEDVRTQTPTARAPRPSVNS